MPWLPKSELIDLISTYGYWAIGGIIALECVGLPVPGEIVLVTAAIYAGSTHNLSIVTVISVATIGGLLGGAAGYWIGHRVGYPLLLRHGHYIRLTQSRIRLGQYLFLHHGGKIVFFGRFVAVLRVLAALLAGANHMAWPRFVFFNAASSVFWAILHGTGGYYFGEYFHTINKYTGIASTLTAIIFIIAALIFLRRYEARLQTQAEPAVARGQQSQAEGFGDRKDYNF